MTSVFLECTMSFTPFAFDVLALRSYFLSEFTTFQLLLIDYFIEICLTRKPPILHFLVCLKFSNSDLQRFHDERTFKVAKSCTFVSEFRFPFHFRHCKCFHRLQLFQYASTTLEENGYH